MSDYDWWPTFGLCPECERHTLAKSDRRVWCLREGCDHEVLQSDFFESSDSDE